MLRQGSSRIAPQTVFQLTWCFRKIFLLTHKFGTAWAVEKTADSEEWSELPIGSTTTTRTRSGTSVIRRSSVSPRAWAGAITYWSQPETVAKSKAATPWRFVIIEPNHSWWWPFKSPTNKKVARTSSACTADIDASKQSKSGHLGQDSNKDCTHKGSVSHHKPQNQHFATTTLKFWLAKCPETISCVCRHPTGPRHLASTQQDRATETGNQQLRHVTYIWDQRLRAKQYVILRRRHGQVTKVPGQAPHFTTEYSADSRCRTRYRSLRQA